VSSRRLRFRVQIREIGWAYIRAPEENRAGGIVNCSGNINPLSKLCRVECARLAGENVNNML
jgi:proteasome assembly chaperone (PAC2) family protein